LLSTFTDAQRTALEKAATEGLTYVLASSHSANIGGDQIDDELIKFFANDFSKTNKTPLTVCSSTDVSDKRAEVKLRLVIEHTKRTISASPGAATCSVESLKDGALLQAQLSHDMVVNAVYLAAASAVSALLADAGVDAHKIYIDEIVYCVEQQHMFTWSRRPYLLKWRVQGGYCAYLIYQL